MRGLIFVGSILLSWSMTVASEPVLRDYSAIRDPGVSYKTYTQRAWPMGYGGVSPIGRSKAYDRQSLSKVIEWTSADELVRNFDRVRDERFLRDVAHSGFQRRSSWLYPDDGCFARAQLANHNLLLWGTKVPNKIFVFGDLTVKTANSPNGEVSWWYHVAPVVKVDGEYYVLDPAIEPEHPLTVDEWLSRQSQYPSELEIAVCQSGAYEPGSDCDQIIDQRETKAQDDQEVFLDSEWSRLIELGRDPQSELGDQPPWR